MRAKYTLKWTGSPAKQLKTKKRALELMKAWRKWKERQGWKCYSSDRGTAIIAKPPRYESFPSLSTCEAIVVRELQQ